MPAVPGAPDVRVLVSLSTAAPGLLRVRVIMEGLGTGESHG